MDDLSISCAIDERNDISMVYTGERIREIPEGKELVVEHGFNPSTDIKPSSQFDFLAKYTHPAGVTPEGEKVYANRGLSLADEGSVWERVKVRKHRGRVVSKTKRMEYVKEHFKMTPHDVLVIAHHVLGYNVVMVGELDDIQWEEVIRQARDFQKDGVLASYLGHK